ncbi:MAG: RagB/SusD family nutrient uptake outer membrane protein [Bacteroidota bacterium]
MKLINKIFILFAGTASLSMATGCKKLLVEDQKTAITQQFFNSPVGVVGGITGVYGTLRGLWGTEGFTNQTVAGTDETLAGGSASGIQTFTYANIASNTDDYKFIFQVAYQDINTLNGVLQYGSTALTDPTQRAQYLAQAKFLRAFLYYYLVINFGDVPLHTTYIADVTTSDSRAPIADVYKQIIQDLTDASADLQNTPTAPFTGKAATKATAYYLLGRAYLTRGWSKAAQTTDFASAVTAFNTLIANKATYGVDMWQDYGDSFKPGNEYGKETLMVIDESSDVKYGNYAAGGSGGSYNSTNYFFRPNYPSMTANYPASTGANMMTRDIANGRPFIRIRPNTNYLTTVFAERTNDSRFDKSFQTAWIANTASVSTPRGALTVGVDTAIWMPPFEVTAARRAAFKGVILTPTGANGGNAYTPVFFPSMRKYDDPNRAGVNDPSTRPFIMYRFSDVYLLAAEAYFKANDLPNAAAMINIVRSRAAYRTTNTVAQNTAAVAAVQILPSQVTLDFILDERSRELYEECTRWWDLVRTQSLGRRLQQYNTEAYPAYSASNPADAFSLRPIPVTEINLVTSGPKFPQNPGY